VPLVAGLCLVEAVEGEPAAAPKKTTDRLVTPRIAAGRPRMRPLARYAARPSLFLQF